MRGKGISLTLAFICVFIFSGCAESRKTAKPVIKSGLLEPQATLKFSDIPAPIGFKFDLEDSYSFESGNLRMGVLRYHGKANPDSVVTFYKEQMPMYNWNFINAVGYGDQLLNFDRPQEMCTVTLSPSGNNVKITISVGPKAQSPQTAEKPVK
jgi:hypothetical protein